jgi:endoglucanase
LGGCKSEQTPAPAEEEYNSGIRLNQIGYYPNAPKKAIITIATQANNFQVFRTDDLEMVYEAKLGAPQVWELAGETIVTADFSDLRTPGKYSVYVEGVGYSFPFEISKDVLGTALRAGMKSNYYQRVGYALDSAHAGQWHRPSGHPDDQVNFHPSTGRTGQTASTGGWYDAGDYGKYVVNGGFSLGQMLVLHEQYPDALPDASLNIPESGNGNPDLLDELKYEMDWILSMQDEDGGSFVKLTTKNFTAMKLPHEVDDIPRFVIGKSTPATLNLAAVAAKMSRAYSEIDSDYSARCLEAAQKAWDWAIAHPEMAYKNPEDIQTGEYGDADFSSEFFWAAAELFISTEDDNYLPYLNTDDLDFSFKEGESWANFAHFLGAFALIDYAKNLDVTKEVSDQLLATAEHLVARTAENDYYQPVDDFQWGSNSDVLNAAMILAQAYRIDPKPTYLQAARETTDYIFGKNATGYCFLTGFGSKSPMFVHHRPSAGDGIDEPVPGFVSGGPNSRKQDAHDVDYPEDAAPMQCWMDVEPSFASNEVCLNWNSALVYVLGFLESEN